MSLLSDVPSPVEQFHHVTFFVSNAYQIIFVFKCSLSPDDPEEIGREVAKHGDFVKDVAYLVDNIESVISSLLQHGHKVLEPTKQIEERPNGSLLTARISGSAGTIVHTLVQNVDYRGLFLPGFKPIDNFHSCSQLPPVPLVRIDHVVEAHPEHTLGTVVDWYERVVRMQRFWSIDDSVVHSEFSALRAVLVANGRAAQEVKTVLVEPANVNGRKRRGQVQEFLDFHGTSGIQHVAFLTADIVEAVEQLRARGVEFLDIPDAYYDLLEDRVGQRTNAQLWRVEADLKRIRELNILMDFDEHGYLLQIFTKPVQDRPTLFLEVIQRHNYNGFGAGNFQALFAAVEMEQRKREQQKQSPPLMNGTGQGIQGTG